MAFDYWHEFIEDGTYHFYNKSVTGEKLFRDSDDFERFITKYAGYFGSYFDTFAYSLIPNHFHFLVKVKQFDKNSMLAIAKEDTKISHQFVSKEKTLNDFLTDQFRRWLSGHALYFNRKYRRTGPLLMNKIKRVGCKSKEQVKDLICYIHHNAIHHGLRQNFGEWPFDSFNQYKNEKDNGIIAREKLIELFGNHKSFTDVHAGYKRFQFEEKYYSMDSNSL